MKFLKDLITSVFETLQIVSVTFKIILSLCTTINYCPKHEDPKQKLLKST